MPIILIKYRSFIIVARLEIGSIKKLSMSTQGLLQIDFCNICDMAKHCSFTIRFRLRNISFVIMTSCSTHIHTEGLTLKVLVATINALGLFETDNYSTVRGDEEVGSARYEPALLPPCPSIRVLSC